MGFVTRFFFAAAGMALSIYSFYVEHQSAKDKNYKAFCDINEQMSCTKVFNSKYGKGFGVFGEFFGKNSILNQPNPVYGIIFYGVVMLLNMAAHHKQVVRLLVHLSVISCIMSIYLATALYNLKDICVVCITTYVVNFALLFVNFRDMNQMPDTPVKSKAD